MKACLVGCNEYFQCLIRVQCEGISTAAWFLAKGERLLTAEEAAVG